MFIRFILRRIKFILPNLERICLIPIAPTKGLPISGRKNKILKKFFPGKEYLKNRKDRGIPMREDKITVRIPREKLFSIDFLITGF